VNWFGLAHIFSLIYLTGIVAFVIGLQEVPEDKSADTQDGAAQPNPLNSPATRHVLGCWGKMLGSLVGLGLIVYILSLFSN
jgi:hypothetical protein